MSDGKSEQPGDEDGYAFDSFIAKAVGAVCLALVLPAAAANTCRHTYAQDTSMCARTHKDSQIKDYIASDVSQT